MLIPLPEGPEHWFRGLDRLVHFGLYAILGGLCRDRLDQPLRQSNHYPWIALVVSVLVVPECLQLLVPSRSFAWLDLLTNVVGLSWGLLVAVLVPGLSYLLIAACLMGFSFTLNQLESFTYQVLFTQYGDWTFWLSLLIPLLVGGTTLRDRSNLALTGMVTGYLIHMTAVQSSPPGAVMILGSLALGLCYLAYRPAWFPEYYDLVASLQLIGTIGFITFVTGSWIGGRIFLRHGGVLVLGSVLLASVLKILLFHFPVPGFLPQHDPRI